MALRHHICVFVWVCVCACVWIFVCVCLGTCLGMGDTRSALYSHDYHLPLLPLCTQPNAYGDSKGVQTYLYVSACVRGAVLRGGNEFCKWTAISAVLFGERIS